MPNNATSETDGSLRPPLTDNKQTEREGHVDRQTDKQTGSHAERQTETYITANLDVGRRT